jgi:hypothetical protein
MMPFLPLVPALSSAAARLFLSHSVLLLFVPVWLPGRNREEEEGLEQRKERKVVLIDREKKKEKEERSGRKIKAPKTQNKRKRKKMMLVRFFALAAFFAAAQVPFFRALFSQGQRVICASCTRSFEAFPVRLSCARDLQTKRMEGGLFRNALLLTTLSLSLSPRKNHHHYHHHQADHAGQQQQLILPGAVLSPELEMEVEQQVPSQGGWCESFSLFFLVAVFFSIARRSLLLPLFSFSLSFLS